MDKRKVVKKNTMVGNRVVGKGIPLDNKRVKKGLLQRLVWDDKGSNRLRIGKKIGNVVNVKRVVGKGLRKEYIVESEVRYQREKSRKVYFRKKRLTASCY